MPEAKWKAVPFKDRDRELVGSLYLDCYGEYSESIWRWTFEELPAAQMERFIELAVEGENIAGQYAIQPHYYSFRQRKIIGAHSLDTMTHPDYRKQGVFVALANRVYERLKEASVPFVFGMPNALSTPAFVKRLEWQSLRPRFHLVAPVGSLGVKKLGLPAVFEKSAGVIPRIARQLGAGGARLAGWPVLRMYNVDEVHQVPADIDELWEEIRQTAAISRWRDREYLEWRYVKIPHRRYRMFTVRGRDGSLDGFFVVNEVQENPAGKIMSLMEFMVRPKSKGAISKMLIALNDLLLESGADFCQAFCPLYRWEFPYLWAGGFYLMPARLFGHSKVQAARYIGEGGPTAEELFASKNWYLSYGDADHV